MKQTLFEGCLHHISSVEAATKKQWLTHQQLADVADTLANHFQDKPRTGYSVIQTGGFKKQN